jgi:hypothetical protein
MLLDRPLASVTVRVTVINPSVVSGRVNVVFTPLTEERVAWPATAQE